MTFMSTTELNIQYEFWFIVSWVKCPIILLNLQTSKHKMKKIKISAAIHTWGFGFSSGNCDITSMTINKRISKWIIFTHIPIN